MTTKTKQRRSIKIAAPMLAILFTLSITSLPPYAFAVDCSQAGAHCYAVVTKDVDNRGGTGTINLNPNNSVDANSAIVNSLWILFADIGPTDREWLEVGWQKGSPMSPCSSTTAKYHTYDAIQSPHGGTCEGATSGSTATLGIYDTNGDDYWGLKINGSQKDTVYKDEDALYMQVGGESTDEDNVLDGGGVASLTYISTSGTNYSWGSSGLSYDTDADYTYNWNTQYTDFGYDGP